MAIFVEYSKVIAESSESFARREKQINQGGKKGKGKQSSPFFSPFAEIFREIKIRRVSTYLPAHVLEEGAQSGLPGCLSTAWSCNCKHNALDC